jgi:3-phenylpropionate/trans-cinnamate dioxygenase ferredoxin reductase subunit
MFSKRAITQELSPDRALLADPDTPLISLLQTPARSAP